MYRRIRIVLIALAVLVVGGVLAACGPKSYTKTIGSVEFNQDILATYTGGGNCVATLQVGKIKISCLTLGDKAFGGVVEVEAYAVDDQVFLRAIYGKPIQTYAEPFDEDGLTELNRLFFDGKPLYAADKGYTVDKVSISSSEITIQNSR